MPSKEQILILVVYLALFKPILTSSLILLSSSPLSLPTWQWSVDPNQSFVTFEYERDAYEIFEITFQNELLRVNSP